MVCMLETGQGSVRRLHKSQLAPFNAIITIITIIIRPPRWTSGKASDLRAEDPGFESRLCQDFFGG